MLLKQLAEVAEDIRSRLKVAGLLSCFADEEWMRSQCHPAEWEDYEAFRRAYNREVLLSRDPAAILFSNPGEYDWQTPIVAERIRQRFDLHGDVHALFANPHTRHLVELTVAQQRRSEMLERASPSARQKYASRNAIFDHLRAEELADRRGIISRVRKRLGSTRPSAESVSRVVLGEVYERALGAALPGPPDSSSALIVRLSDDWLLAMQPGVRIESGAADGKLIIQFFLHQSLPETAKASFPSDDDLIFYRLAMPDAFSAHSAFQGKPELMLACAAWTEVGVLTLQALRERGPISPVTPI